jgi:hypothetical protein
MATVRNFEDMSDKSEVDRISTEVISPSAKENTIMIMMMMMMIVVISSSSSSSSSIPRVVTGE